MEIHLLFFFRSHTVTNHTSQKSTESPHPPFLDRGVSGDCLTEADQFVEESKQIFSIY